RAISRTRRRSRPRASARGRSKPMARPWPSTRARSPTASGWTSASGRPSSTCRAWPNGCGSWSRSHATSTCGWPSRATISRREIVLARILVPEDARRLLERLEAVERLWQANVARALDRALLALDAAGIQTVALKGPALAERLYPEAAMRRCTDLDLLIAERDIERAARALEPLGYELEDGLAALYARRHHHHLHLAGRCPPVIELHLRAYVGFGVTLPAETLLARARAHPPGGGA